MEGSECAGICDILLAVSGPQISTIKKRMSERVKEESPRKRKNS